MLQNIQNIQKLVQILQLKQLVVVGSTMFLDPVVDQILGAQTSLAKLSLAAWVKAK